MLMNNCGRGHQEMEGLQKRLRFLSLQSGPVMFDRLEVALAIKDLMDVGLFREHFAVDVASYPGQSPPSFEILWVSLIAMRFFSMLPVPCVSMSVAIISVLARNYYPLKRLSTW